MTTQDTTFSIPTDLLESLRRFAAERQETPDQLVAEALRAALNPLRQEALRRLNAEAARHALRTKVELQGPRTAALDPGDEKRLAVLLALNRERTLTAKERDELDALYERIEQVATTRAAAVGLLAQSIESPDRLR